MTPSPPESLESIKLQDKASIKLTYRSRIITLAGLCALLLLVILFKFIDLQWLQHDRFKLQSNENRLNLMTLPPMRGHIYDRKGRLLASNQTIYNLTFKPQPEKNIQEQIKIINEILNSDISLDVLEKRKRSNAAVLLKKQLTETEVAKLSARFDKLPNTQISTSLQRIYPYANSASHLIGYTDTIKQGDLNRTNVKLLTQYDRFGRTGIESFYDEHLRGKPGHATLEQNVYGTTVRTLQKTSPISGKDLYLSIDIEFQQYIESLLAPYQGAVTVQHVKTGEILALVSMPNFNLNIADHNKQSKAYKMLIQHQGKPFLNRAIQGQYPPASTLKPFLALAALEDAKWNPVKKLNAGSYYQLPETRQQRFFYDWKKGGHGWIDLTQAIVRSSDVYFYNMAFNVGIDVLSGFLKHFFWGRTTGIDLHGEAKGILPSREWKANAKFEAWFPGETVVFGIGQGYSLVTPLQLAVNTSILANRGKIIPPRLTLSRERDENKTPSFINTQIAIKKHSHWNLIEHAMQRTITSPFGTAKNIADKLTVTLAGKTGTAQVISLSQDPEIREKQKRNLKKRQQDHALFIGYAPVKNPQISLSIIIEHQGSGGSIAAPLSAKIINKYFELYPDQS